ncbi:MAG: hypothetical protein KJO07_22055 [Deltaproteobacteria bacterium]|nr:hypothetical protein [Deltaproteobacteria bacterium]
MNELSPNARALLDSARATDEPSAGDRNRVRAAVFAAVGLPVPAAETVASEAAKAGLTSGSQAAVVGKTASLALSWKLLAVVAVVGGVGTGVYVTQRDAGDSERGASLERSAQPAAVAEAPSPAPPQPAPVAIPETEDQAPEPSTAPTRVPAPTPKNKARPVPETAPAIPESTEKPKPKESASPEPGEQPPPPTSTSSLRAEHALLSRARAALRKGDSIAALRTLEAHRQRHPGGTLVQERRVLEVLVRCARGQEDKAKKLAERFRSDYPNSPLERRLESSCAGSGR